MCLGSYHTLLVGWKQINTAPRLVWEVHMGRGVLGHVNTCDAVLQSLWLSLSMHWIMLKLMFDARCIFQLTSHQAWLVNVTACDIPVEECPLQFIAVQ